MMRLLLGWAINQRPMQYGLIGLLMLFCAGCDRPTAPDITPPSTDSVQAASNSCSAIPHQWGQTQLCQRPQRVIALDPHGLDLLISLGIQPIGYAEDRRALIGSPESGQPIVQIKYLGDRLTQKPVHVGTWQTPSLETILQLKPDLIVGRISSTLYATLSRLSPTLPLSYFQEERWQDTLLKIGRATQREPLAQKVIAQHQQHLTKARQDLQPVTQRTQLLLLAMTSPEQIAVLTDNTFAGELLKNAGFKLVVPTQLAEEAGQISLSFEVLPQLPANTIIVLASGNSTKKLVAASDSALA
jgi:iron complex transport system substrate-binding protein